MANVLRLLMPICFFLIIVREIRIPQVGAEIVTEQVLSECLVDGPGIIPQKVILPARYFFIVSNER